MKAYIDISTTPGSTVTEYSMHGLTLHHMRILMWAVKSFGHCSDEDFNALAVKITDLSEYEMNLLVDAAAFRKASQELMNLLIEMD